MHKCPSCGGDLKSFALKCSLCGHELSTAQVPSPVQGLVDRLTELSSELDMPQARQAEAIRNWPIPVSTADLLEFTTFAGSNAMVGVGSASVLSDAWRAKALEAVAKGRIAFKEGDKGFDAIRDLERCLASDQKTRMTVGATRGLMKIVLIGGGIVALLFLALLGAVAIL